MFQNDGNLEQSFGLCQISQLNEQNDHKLKEQTHKQQLQLNNKIELNEKQMNQFQQMQKIAYVRLEAHITAIQKIIVKKIYHKKFNVFRQLCKVQSPIVLSTLQGQWAYTLTATFINRISHIINNKRLKMLSRAWLQLSSQRVISTFFDSGLWSHHSKGVYLQGALSIPQIESSQGINQNPSQNQQDFQQNDAYGIRNSHNENNRNRKNKILKRKKQKMQKDIICFTHKMDNLLNKHQNLLKKNIS